MSETLPSDLFGTFTLNLKIIFRSACEEDLPNLEWEGEYTHFRRVMHSTFREQTAHRRLMLLADLNGYPIGQIYILFKYPQFILQKGKPHGYLYSLRVMKGFRKLGIGRALILQAEEIVRTQGLTHSVISVAKDNSIAQRLYENLGYQIYAEDEGRWSYTNHEGRIIPVHEPAWMLYKVL